MVFHMKCVLLLVVVATLAICVEGRPKPKPKYYGKKYDYHDDHDDHYHDDHYHDDHYDHHGYDDDCHDDHDHHYDGCKQYKAPPKKYKQDCGYGGYGNKKNYGGCEDDCDCNSGKTYKKNYSSEYGKKKEYNYGKKSYSSSYGHKK